MKNSLIFILLLLSCFSVCFNIRQLNRKETQCTEVIVRDTIVDVVVDYDTVYLSKTVYKDRYHYDTITVDNIVYLKDTLHSYDFKEKDYDLSVRAMKLDSYKLDIHARDTIHYPHTTIVTTTKQKRFNVALQAGAGYGVINRKPDLFVGVGVSYNIY